MSTYVDYASVTRRRVARKPHRCEAHSHPIRVGDVYLEHTIFPGHDSGWATDRPVRSAECARCAQRYGREFLLDDVPVEQVYRDGLA